MARVSPHQHQHCVGWEGANEHRKYSKLWRGMNSTFGLRIITMTSVIINSVRDAKDADETLTFDGSSKTCDMPKDDHRHIIVRTALSIATKRK
jgi:hypothetical protein